MEGQRWVNPTHPQTLHIAVVLLYIDAAISAIQGGYGSIIGLALIVGSVAAGYGIANERKWGYWLGIGIAAFGLYLYLPFFLTGQIGRLFHPQVLISFAFAVAQMVLLVHPMSRSYVKTWFK